MLARQPASKAHGQIPTDQPTRTFAALGCNIVPPVWAITAFAAARIIDTFAFAVTPAVAFQALVHV